jgi:nucleotidyltransferase/DNA polymerase involved in DNA repair
METTATILHADLDAFYASVEQLLDPSLRGKPIAVGGGVVLAASYEAKAFGVSGGMAGRRARELCPQLIFVGGHFSEYQRLGDAAINVLNDFTPLVERISIDEAFADVAGCTHLFGSPAEIAGTIRRRVRAELGLPISIGVARTKHLAKIASQVAKPDGLVVVDPKTELNFLHDLPVELMWGVGPATKARLAEQGIHTIGQLANMPGWSLQRVVGRAIGEKLSALAWNRDPREINRHRRAQSAGAQSALGRKPAQEQVFRPTLRHLADRIATRLLRLRIAGCDERARKAEPVERVATRRAQDGLGCLAEDVPLQGIVGDRSAGRYVERAVTRRIPGAQPVRRAVHAGALRADADPGIAFADEVVGRAIPLDVELPVVGDVLPLDDDLAVELPGIGRPAHHHARTVRMAATDDGRPLLRRARIADDSAADRRVRIRLAFEEELLLDVAASRREQRRGEERIVARGVPRLRARGDRADHRWAPDGEARRRDRQHREAQ